MSPVWAERILAVMEAQGRRQGWLARQIGMRQDVLSRTLAGEPYRYFTPEQQTAIAKALGVPESLLFPPEEDAGGRSA